MDMINQIFGTEVESLLWYQAAARAVLVYAIALMLVRVGEKRFMGKFTAFDVILGIILGSVISRAVNSSGSILPTLIASLMLVLLHWLMAVISYKSDNLGSLFKGNARLLVKDGDIQWDTMAKTHISRKDLEGQIRSEANTEDVSSIKKAYLERSGNISVIPSSGEPKILSVDVADGVQTVRIVLEL